MTARPGNDAPRSTVEGCRPPLFKRFPGLEGKIARIPLGDFPTPVERLTHLGHGNLWIKREDRSSGSYGGNKVRKLEFALADAKRRGCTGVITMGGIGTNHGLATAVFCRKLGLGCRLVLFKQPVNRYVQQNLLLFSRYGAEIVYREGMIRTGASLLVTERLTHPRGYILVAGGSSPVGTVGIVNAMLELGEQVDAGLLPAPRYVFCPLGSNGTMAGLSLGALLAGLPTTVIGVRVSVDCVGPITVATPENVAKLMRQTHRLLKKADPRVPDVTVKPPRVINDYLGDGYGCATDECRKALEIMKDREGISLDPTYTGKTFAALLDRIRDPEFAKVPVLYWHTYNSVDLSGEAAAVDYRDLPESLHWVFENGEAAG